MFILGRNLSQHNPVVSFGTAFPLLLSLKAVPFANLLGILRLRWISAFYIHAENGYRLSFARFAVFKCLFLAEIFRSIIPWLALGLPSLFCSL